MGHPSGLSWADVAPALTPEAAVLSPDAVAQIALPAIPPTRPADRRAGHEVEREIDALFRARFGAHFQALLGQLTRRRAG